MRAIGVIASVVALSGSIACGSKASRPATQPTDTRGTVQPLLAKFSGTCVVPASEVTTIIPQAALGPALAAILIPKAAGVAVDFVGQLLQKVGSDKKATMQASTGPYLYRVTAWSPQLKGRTLDILPSARCLHLLSFSEAGSNDWSTVVAGTSRDPAAIKLVQETLGMTDRPAPTFYMEFAVALAADQSSFMLVPTFLKYGRGFSGRGTEAELVSAITFARPGAEKPFASTVVMLRDLRIGQTYDVDALLGSASEWMPLDAPSESVAEAKGKPAPAAAEQARQFDPINVKSVLTETRDGIALLKALGESISGAKDDVAKAVGESLPSQEKKDAAAASRLDDRNAYLSAMEDVKVKQAELSSKTEALERVKAEAEVTKSKLVANKAALKAGIAVPFPDLYISD